MADLALNLTLVWQGRLERGRFVAHKPGCPALLAAALQALGEEEEG